MALVQTASNTAELLTEEALDQITRFIEKAQCRDGGFAGRDGTSDIYYTMFGLYTLLAFNRKPQYTGKLMCYIRTCRSSLSLDFVHLNSLMRCLTSLHELGLNEDFPEPELLQQLEAFRSGDGGYSHLAKSASDGTAYAGYLAAQAYCDMERPMPQPSFLKNSLVKLQAPTGGYRNETGSTDGNVTATASAILLHLYSGAEEKAVPACEWLLKQAAPGGGFCATSHAPFPDLLSTATALYALKSAKIAVPNSVSKQTLDFVTDCWHENGGFCGTRADSIPDLEYTFYALLSLGCLHS